MLRLWRSTLFPYTTLFRSGITIHRITRFIPAPAGNTRPDTLPDPLPPVHPRTCGEHSTPNVLLRPDNGSSPHLRGTRISRERDRKSTRLNSSHVKISYAVF